MICIMCGRTSTVQGWLCQQCISRENPKFTGHREATRPPDNPLPVSTEEWLRDLPVLLKFIWFGFVVTISVIAFAILGLAGIFVAVPLTRMTYKGFTHPRYGYSNAPSRSPNTEPSHQASTEQSSTAASPSPKRPSSSSKLQKLRPFIVASILAVLIAAGIMQFWPRASSENSKGKGQSVVSGRTDAIQPSQSITLIEKQNRASAGDVDAMTWLGNSYLNGLNGVDKEYSKAASWFSKAKDSGDPRAFNQLGLMYQQGLGVPRDWLQAMPLFVEAHEHGSKVAAYNIGYAYQKGLGPETNYTEAFKWYAIAARRGSPDAVNSIGYMFSNGLGVKEDSTEALGWFALAVKMGSQPAVSNYNAVAGGGSYFSSNCGTEAVEVSGVLAGPADGVRPRFMCEGAPLPKGVFPLDPREIGSNSVVPANDSALPRREQTVVPVPRTAVITESPVRRSNFPDAKIRQVLDAWVESFKSRDATRHADCYAPMIERYFLQNNVNHDQLRRNKDAAFQRISEVRQYDIADVTIANEASERYSATFNKTWNYLRVDGTIVSGEEIQRLVFDLFDGQWKIVREEEVKIIHVEKSTTVMLDHH
jgi:TPR repeat protein